MKEECREVSEKLAIAGFKDVKDPEPRCRQLLEAGKARKWILPRTSRRNIVLLTP